MKSFQHYLDEVNNWTLDGWDFSSLQDRWHNQETSWDYRNEVIKQIDTATAMLDMDTGGGEFLAGLPNRPAICHATEAYAPNVPVARDRLKPLGIDVADVAANGKLPYADNSFDLIINRHGAFNAHELARLLKPGGRFLTQQVGCEDNRSINKALCAADMEHADWSALEISNQLEQAGFCIDVAKEEFPASRFDDIGVLMIYLKAIPWQISGYQLSDYESRLRALHDRMQQEGAFISNNHRIWVQARIPEY